MSFLGSTGKCVGEDSGGRRELNDRRRIILTIRSLLLVLKMW
jgi:hypothetical protein